MPTEPPPPYPIAFIRALAQRTPPELAAEFSHLPSCPSCSAAYGELLHALDSGWADWPDPPTGSEGLAASCGRAVRALGCAGMAEALSDRLHGLLYPPGGKAWNACTPAGLAAGVQELAEAVKRLYAVVRFNGDLLAKLALARPSYIRDVLDYSVLLERAAPVLGRELVDRSQCWPLDLPKKHLQLGRADAREAIKAEILAHGAFLEVLRRKGSVPPPSFPISMPGVPPWTELLLAVGYDLAGKRILPGARTIRGFSETVLGAVCANAGCASVVLPGNPLTDPGCKDRMRELRQCQRCKLQRYCSKECQAADWKHHRVFCGKEGRPTAEELGMPAGWRPALCRAREDGRDRQ